MLMNSPVISLYNHKSEKMPHIMDWELFWHSYTQLNGLLLLLPVSCLQLRAHNPLNNGPHFTSSTVVDFLSEHTVIKRSTTSVYHPQAYVECFNTKTQSRQHHSYWNVSQLLGFMPPLVNPLYLSTPCMTVLQKKVEYYKIIYK